MESQSWHTTVTDKTTGTKSIPEHYFEAAKIDGATSLQTHLKVTIPLLAETYRITAIFAFVGGLNAFGHISIMTKGGPGTATYTLTYFMYRAAFRLDQYGYGCAVAVLIVLQSIVITLLINTFTTKTILILSIRIKIIFLLK